MIAKIVLGKEIHMYRGNSDLQQLRQYCCAVFRGMQDTINSLEFYYFDEDADKINITTQHDLSALYNLNKTHSIKKIYI